MKGVQIFTMVLVLLILIGLLLEFLINKGILKVGIRNDTYPMMDINDTPTFNPTDFDWGSIPIHTLQGDIPVIPRSF
jgi:hypothetical protein